MYDELPAFESTTSSEMIRTNLNAHHASRTAFTQKESCEKLRRAMLHKVRPTGESFHNGEHVFYRRSNYKHWQGPATVIGQENKQILVKHGGVYYRCHSCNLIKKNGKIFGNNDEQDNKIGPKVDVHQGYEQEESPIRRIYVNEEEDKCDEQTSQVSNELSTPASDFNNSLVPSCDTCETDNVNESYDSEINEGMEGLSQHKNTTDDVISQQKPLLPNPQTRIAYVQNNNPCWKNATVLGCAGKVTGKNKYCLNILDDGDESGKCINWRNVDDWKEIDEPINFCSDEDILDAKMKELSNWKINDVYETVPHSGQKVINCRWVMKEKLKTDGSTFVKARLVARGFEEDSSSMQTDSPTCGKESLRVVFVIAASRKMEL